MVKNLYKRRFIREIGNKIHDFAAFCFEYSDLVLHLGIKLGLDVIVSEGHVGEGS